MKKLIRYFITRRTKHDNYKVLKIKRLNGQKYYHVSFKDWFTGWHTEQEYYDSVTSIDKTFNTKIDATLFIENAINKAYSRLI